MGKYLGIDASTQSLTALVIDTDSNSIIYERSVNFGTDLPEFSSPNGFIESKDPMIRHANPLMWLAAIDLLFQKMLSDKFNFSEILCVSGSGQQHGSVYLNEKFISPENWNNGTSLSESLAPMLTRTTSPIWMDSSTSEECKEIADFAGGNQIVCQKSGSIVIERFTGSQIRKFYKERPEDYQKTAVIHLVSSFMASILAGKSAPIDAGDGAGMNLMNIKTASWDKVLVKATAPGLLKKLPPLASSNTVIGSIAPYFVKKYGFSADCAVNVWSGDNPNSLVGLGASEAGTVVISLGTSDTFMAAFDTPFTDPNGYGHVFCNPAGGFMCLICFKNGSLAREKIRDEFDISWQTFTKAFSLTSPGNNGNMMLPFYIPEITPKTSAPRVEFIGEDDFKERKSMEKAVRAIVEAQMINMKIHSEWTGIRVKKIKLTGGASKCPGICQTVADVFQTPVEQFTVTNSAGVGAALRAVNAHTGESLHKLAENIVVSSETRTFYPNRDAEQIYQILSEKFRVFLHE